MAHSNFHQMPDDNFYEMQDDWKLEIDERLLEIREKEKVLLITRELSILKIGLWHRVLFFYSLLLLLLHAHLLILSYYFAGLLLLSLPFRAFPHLGFFFSSHFGVAAPAFFFSPFRRSVFVQGERGEERGAGGGEGLPRLSSNWPNPFISLTMGAGRSVRGKKSSEEEHKDPY